MNQKQLDNALNHLDADLIEGYLQETESRGRRALPRLRRLEAVAASLVLVAIGVGIALAWREGQIHYDEPVGNPELGNSEYATRVDPNGYVVDPGFIDSAEGWELVIENGPVWIHYVTAEGKTERVKVELPYAPQNIFAVWREKNGLGEDVKLISTRVNSNGVEETYEFEGEGVVSYRPGDRFSLTVTVEGLEPYLTDENRSALLEALKQTMSGYQGREFEAVEVVLE